MRVGAKGGTKRVHSFVTFWLWTASLMVLAGVSPSYGVTRVMVLDGVMVLARVMVLRVKRPEG